MTPLNHQHLFYFWTVAREGSVTKACQKLCLTQPTISGQIIQLEKALGHKLFERDRNRLILTDRGRIALRYANDIFEKTQEFMEVFKTGSNRARTRLSLGIDAHVSKQVAMGFLREIYRQDRQTQLTLMEGGLSELLLRMRHHDLDLLLCEQLSPRMELDDYVKTEVGRLEVIFVAAPRWARHVQNFPHDLSNLPILLPMRDSPLRAAIERFLVHHRITPRSAGEMQDAEFMRLLAVEGLGVAPLHELAVTADLRSGRLVRLGRRATEIYKTLWLVAGKRRDDNPAIAHLMKEFRL